jgi:hypothetical protein
MERFAAACDFKYRRSIPVNLALARAPFRETTQRPRLCEGNRLRGAASRARAKSMAVQVPFPSQSFTLLCRQRTGKELADLGC